MVFSICDVELLRLLRWCRYIAPSDLLGFDELTIESLKTMKLIRSQRSSKYLTLTGKGKDCIPAFPSGCRCLIRHTTRYGVREYPRLR